MNIVPGKKFRILIYANDHPPPHCHVRFPDESEVTVDIPLIQPRYGRIITKEVRDAIEENLEKITKAWDKFHVQKKNNNYKEN